VTAAGALAAPAGHDPLAAICIVSPTATLPDTAVPVTPVSALRPNNHHNAFIRSLKSALQ
jgi:hypothetical protein